MHTPESASDAAFERPLVGISPAIREVQRLADLAAASNATVLIEGETGTGKEVVARRIHARSPRKDGPFEAVNMSGSHGTLGESEFFGHVRGAFTGAHIDREGHFERANKGSLFMDEVGEIPLTLQKMLLRVMQEKELRRLMDSRTKSIDVRIIAATNRNIDDLKAAGLMREDFYYRLKMCRIFIPPLRERLEDLPLLVEHLLRVVSLSLFPANPPSQVVEPGVLELLARHPWPGNVRELEHALAAAVVLSPERITCEKMLPLVFGTLRSPAILVASGPLSLAPKSLSLRLDECTREILDAELARAHGCKRVAATALEISESKLFRLCRQFRGARTLGCKSRSVVTGGPSLVTDMNSAPELFGPQRRAAK